jgi:hypothetical protein
MIKLVKSALGGWVINVRYFCGRVPEERFYVGFEDPHAALLAVCQATNIGRGDTIEAARRLSARHAKLLRLRSGEVRAV